MELIIDKGKPVPPPKKYVIVLTEEDREEMLKWHKATYYGLDPLQRILSWLREGV